MKLQFVASLLSTSALVDAFSTSASIRASSATRLYERKPFISGNWKLNPQSKDEAIALASGIADSITESSPDAEVAVFVPYVFIETAQSAVGGKLSIGAEGVCPQGNGAFTGAISAPMLNSIGELIHIHSVKRRVARETNKLAFKILCECMPSFSDARILILHVT